MQYYAVIEIVKKLIVFFLFFLSQIDVFAKYGHGRPPSGKEDFLLFLFLYLAAIACLAPGWLNEFQEWRAERRKKQWSIERIIVL